MGALFGLQIFKLGLHPTICQPKKDADDQQRPYD